MISYARVCEELVAASHRMHGCDWVPATSGNFSARTGPKSVAITQSGRDKGQLHAGDLMEIDLDGGALRDGKPSAETGLHLQLYRRDPTIGAVLHSHSLNQVIASDPLGTTANIEFTGLELLKAFSGVTTHTARVRFPIFDNDQNIPELAARVERHMAQHGQGLAYLIRGHGAYCWGATVADCWRQLEALEYLLEWKVRTDHR